MGGVYYETLQKFNINAGNQPVTKGNSVEVFTDGRKKFIDLLETMDKAVRHIFIQYYIIRDGGIFSNIEEVAIRKAAQGVSVKIMTDGIGGRGLSNRTIERLRMNNVEVAVYSPSLIGCVNFQINHRNHRKTAIIDDVAYIGGFNLGDEYIGEDKRYGYWRDTHLKIKGMAAESILKSFADDWKTATGKDIHTIQGGENKCEGEIDIQIVRSGYKDKVKLIHDSYLRMIYSAKKSIYIQTPYFVPDMEMLNALKSAARSGIDVKIMVPGRADHPAVYWATGYYAGHMIRAGAGVYRYMDGFLHAKGIMIDGEVCTFGTANMDIRSFRLNYEINVIIYNEGFTRKMENIFCDDLKKCDIVSRYKYENMGTLSKLKCIICRGGARYM